MLLTVGRIVRPHGIHGEVIVDVRTDEPDARFAVGTALVAQAPSAPRSPSSAGPPSSAGSSEAGAHGVRWQVPPTLTVEAARSHLGRLIITFNGVYDRNVAEELRGVALCVDSEDLSPPEDPDEFHDHQLVGLSVVTTTGEVVGEVTRVDHAPASDLLVLRCPDGRSALVPFVKAIVPEVDLAAGRIVVDPPAGLLDL